MERPERRARNQRKLLGTGLKPEVRLLTAGSSSAFRRRERADCRTQITRTGGTGTTMQRTQKTCEGCNRSIFVARKTCPHCQHQQPHKKKLSQKREEFQKSREVWAASVKKNNNCSVIVNRCHLMLDKIAALDYVPILLLGKIKGRTVTADVMLPKNNSIERGLVLSVQKAFDSALKVHFKRKSQSLDGLDQDHSDQDGIREEGSSSGSLDLPDGPPAQEPKRGHRRRTLESGEQQQFEGLPEKEVPPEEPERNLSENQEEPEHPDIKEEEEEPDDITAVAVKTEEDEVHLSGFDQNLKEENREDCGEPGPARTSGPEGPLEPDQQQLQVKTPNLEQEETGSCDFKVKEEADVVAVKSEGNEEGAEFSQLHQRVTEDREDCGGPGLARTSGPDGHLGPGTEDGTRSSESEDSVDWMTPLESQLQIIRNQIKFGLKPFSCSDCGERSKHKDELRTHERTHTGEKPYSCSDCGERSKRKVSLRTHETIHTGEKPFSCSACGKKFAQMYTLREHERIHTGEKPFSCFECGRKFSQKGSLTKHERIHSGEKPFSCSQCGKKFSRKGSLSKHERIHSGEKPFNCSQCGKKFSRKCSLSKHERTHSGEKPFNCSQCGRKFRHKSSLISHERIHTGKKPFSCSQCGKNFSRKGSLSMHERVHSGEKPFNCSQ